MCIYSLRVVTGCEQVLVKNGETYYAVSSIIKGLNGGSRPSNGYIETLMGEKLNLLTRFEDIQRLGYLRMIHQWLHLF